MNTHAATVGGDIVLAPLDPPVLERLRRELSFPNPTFVRASRLGFYADHLPARIEALVEQADGAVRIPRGSVQIARDVILRRGGAKLVFEDHRTGGEELGELLGPVPMRDYQIEAVDALQKKLQGLAVLPPGCGKSRLGVGAIDRLRVSTIIIVPTGDLADQWAATLLEFTGIEACIMGGGAKRVSSGVVITTPESLEIELARTPSFAERFGLCVVDEAHVVPCTQYGKLLAQIPARYRLGLTATPDREDGLTRWVYWSFGDVLIERDIREMVHLGYLLAAEIEEVETDFRWAPEEGLPEKKKIAALEEACAEDFARNILIADRAVEEARAGESVLVLVGRREWARDLAETICARGATALACTSKTGKKKRKEAIAALRDGSLPVLVATSLADEGVDVQRLSRVLLAVPAAAKGRTAQRLGRLLRDFPGKKPKLIDFVDSLVPTFARRAQSRRRVWKEAGFIESRRKRT